MSEGTNILPEGPGRLANAINRLANAIKQTARVRDGQFSYLLILLVGIAAIAVLHRHAAYEDAAARESFTVSSRVEARTVAARASQVFREIHQGLRLIARLPGVRGMNRYASNVSVDAQQAAQEVFRNLAGNLGMSALYIVPASIRTDALDSAAEYLESSETISNARVVGRDAALAFGSGAAVFEKHAWRSMRQQIQHFRPRFPHPEPAAGDDHPAVGTPMVSAFDDREYSASGPADAQRSGLVHSVPIYDSGGTLEGLVSGVILSSALANLLPSGHFALRSEASKHAIFNAGGQATASADWVARGEADPTLIYSEVIALETADAGSQWALWAGYPDAVFAARANIPASRRFAQLDYFAIALLCACLAIFVRINTRESATIERRVAARTQELDARIRKLTCAQETERQFTEDLAHELRTPLASLNALVHVAAQSRSESAYLGALARIEAAVRQTSRLAEQLLTLTRVGSKQTRARKYPVDIRLLTRTTLAHLIPQADEKAISVAFEANERFWVLGDEHLLSILLRNLVENAVLYTPERGDIVITIARSETGVRLDVANSGPGIPQRYRQQVMERFYRIPGTSESGSGLGLSIVSRIAELHETRIEITNANRPFSGTMIRVELPCADVD